MFERVAEALHFVLPFGPETSGSKEDSVSKDAAVPRQRRWLKIPPKAGLHERNFVEQVFDPWLAGMFDLQDS